MRELGVLSCDGIVLGPEPTLAARVAYAPPDIKPALTQELAEEMRRTRLASLRAGVRDMLPNGYDYSDEQIDRYIDPRQLEAL
jgi:hypothetical protein